MGTNTKIEIERYETEILNTKNPPFLSPKIKIDELHFIITGEFNRQFVARLSGIEEIDNHLNVELYFITWSLFEKDKYEVSIPNDWQIEGLVSYFKIIRDYWIEYASRNNKNGVMFIYHRENLNEALVGALPKVLKKDKESKAVLESYVQEYLGYHYLGGILSSSFVTKLMDLFKVAKIIDRAFDEISYFSLDNSYQNPYFLLFEDLQIKLGTENIKMKWDPDHKNLVLAVQNQTQEIEYKVNARYEELTEKIKEIYENTSLKRLVVSSTNNFARLIDFFDWEMDENFIEEEFDKFEHKFKSWEKAEELFHFLLKKAKKDDFKKMIHLNDSESKNQITSIRFFHDDCYYFFTYRVFSISGEGEWYQFNTYFSQEPAPLEWKNNIFDWIVRD